MPEHRHRVLDVLDRLQEHDRVVASRRAEGLHQSALEAQVLALVAQPRVLVGLGVGVDADHVGRGARQNLGAVALPAGHIEDPAPENPRADPLINGEMAAIPIVLLRHVGQRALAGQL